MFWKILEKFGYFLRKKSIYIRAYKKSEKKLGKNRKLSRKNSEKFHRTEFHDIFLQISQILQKT